MTFIVGRAIGTIADTSERVLMFGPGDGSRIMVSRLTFFNNGSASLKVKVYAKRFVSERVRLRFTGTTFTGGNFTLVFGAQTTAVIPYNATAGDVQGFLEALSSIGADNVQVVGGSLPYGQLAIDFINDLRYANQGAITIGTNSLTGTGTPTPVIDVQQDGSPTIITNTFEARSMDGSGDGFGGTARFEHPGGAAFTILDNPTDMLCAVLSGAPVAGNVDWALTYASYR
jgi:hypothetical protein